MTPWTAAHQASLSFTIIWNLFKLMSIQSVMLSYHLILCHPFLLLPSIFPSIRVFSKESALHTRQPKYWSFSFSISPSRESSGLISLRIDWLDLLAVQGNLKSFSSTTVFKSISSLVFSLLYGSTLTPVHDYWKNHSLDFVKQSITFISKVMSLLLKIKFRFVITFLPRSKHLLISRLQSPSAMILEPPKNKVCHCFHCFPIYLP